MSDTFRELLRRVATAQADARLPSVVAAIARDGELLWSGGRGDTGGGLPTTDTQYRIGSISKTFVAVLVMRLRDEGRLRLTDTVEQHLSGSPVGTATVAQLLSHTSGLATETPPPWWEGSSGEFRPALGDLFWTDPFRHPAGRRWHYSNTGYAVLGAIVGQLRGQHWYDALRSEVLAPLAMSRTTLLPEAPHALGWSVHPWADMLLPEPLTNTGLMAPAGQLWSTAADLVRFGEVLHGRCADVVAADTIAEMRESASGEPDPNLSYGLGVMGQRNSGVTFYGHHGSMPGFVASLLTDPAQGLTAVTFANSTLSPAIVPLALDLLRIVTEREPRIPAVWTGSPEAPELIELTGIWYRGSLPFTVRLLADNELELARVDAAGLVVRFRPHGDETWIATTPGYTNGEILQVARDAEGRPVALDLGSIAFTRELVSAS